MDVATVDQEYAQLQSESGALTQAIEDFATKLQTAGNAGDASAKEWVLDLKGIALQIQQEQLQMQALLMSLHDFVGNALGQATQVPTSGAGQPQGGGGVLSRFRSSGFGQAMTQGAGMGVGFGLADSAINSIFS